MSVTILVGIAAVLFVYRLADGERLNPWPWVAASILLLVLASERFPGALGLIGSQLLLLVAMTVFNMTRQRRW